MIDDYLKKDTMLLYGFLTITVLMVVCALACSAGAGGSFLLLLGSAVLCIGALTFSFLTIRHHLVQNAEELYGEEINGSKE